jgi:hypothetical protein
MERRKSHHYWRFLKYGYSFGAQNEIGAQNEFLWVFSRSNQTRGV